MEEAEIRVAKRKETSLIQYLISRSIGEGDFLLPRTDKEIAELIDKGRFFVAIEGRDVVGCASLEEYDGIAELRSVVVGGEWRGKGMGAGLIESVELLAGKNHDSIYTFADKNLVGFYEKLDFKDLGKFLEANGETIGREISQKMERYCMKCYRYKSGVCREHLMYKRLNEA